MTYKYPLAKVKSFVPKNYRSVITELFNTHPEADRAQFLYSKRLLNMIVQVGGSEDFIVALTQLIKCLAVGHMHIVGDFFDRGNRPDTILDMLLEYHSLDIQWGNHDILWKKCSRCRQRGKIPLSGIGKTCPGCWRSAS